MENPIRRYLEDAIAAEKSFETQLKGFAKEAAYDTVRSAFRAHADETQQQYEALTQRLKSMDGSPSEIKSVLAHLFNAAPRAGQLGHSAEERTTQDLIMAYAVENAEVAMYEAMAIAADAVGDRETEELARQIQAEEKETAATVWMLIGSTASKAFTSVTTSNGVDGKRVILRYLEDAEAAERNFEDALASFSRIGDQTEVQNLMAMMSGQARSQYKRLEARLMALGGSRSTGKSILAHMLAFAPVTAQVGHVAAEKSAQHLMITCAAAAAEMGMYESLYAAAETAGDPDTARLARQLQSEEKEDHRLAFQHLERVARNATMQALRA